jgi:hypothetical protein
MNISIYEYLTEEECQGGFQMDAPGRKMKVL